MMSKSLTGDEKETSTGAFPAPLVSTVKWVGLPLSIPGGGGAKGGRGEGESISVQPGMDQNMGGFKELKGLKNILGNRVCACVHVGGGFGWEMVCECICVSLQPVRASPGPSALTFDASCEGSTFTVKGLNGTSCGGKTNKINKNRNRTLSKICQRFVNSLCVCVCMYLVREQDFDSQFSSSRRNVLDCERVVGVGDDVKLHISLLVTDHVGFTLNAHTDIT